jgi:hypothetical protein
MTPQSAATPIYSYQLSQYHVIDYTISLFSTTNDQSQFKYPFPIGKIQVKKTKIKRIIKSISREKNGVLYHFSQDQIKTASKLIEAKKFIEYKKAVFIRLPRFA